MLAVVTFDDGGFGTALSLRGAGRGTGFGAGRLGNPGVRRGMPYITTSIRGPFPFRIRVAGVGVVDGNRARHGCPRVGPGAVGTS